MKSSQPVSNSSWLLFLSIAMMTILLAGTVLSGKLVTFGYSTLQTGATVTFPLAFLISGVVAEVYGYNTSKKLIWFIIICGFLFAFLIEGVLRLPSPPSWNKQEAYQQVFGGGNVLKFTIAGTLGIIVGLFINSYIITKTKILIHGKHFWLRSLGAVAVGEAAHILVVLFLLHWTTLNRMLATGLTMYVFRMLCVLLFLAPTQVLVNFIKKREQISYNDYDIIFNPFKFH